MASTPISSKRVSLQGRPVSRSRSATMSRPAGLCERPWPGIGDLALADEAVDIAERDLEAAAARLPAAGDAHPVRAYAGHAHLREIGHHVGLEVACGIVDLVE